MLRNVNVINYKFLSEAQQFYSQKEYSQIDVPWWVSKEIAKVTTPSEDCQDWFLNHNNKYLIASGEQGFLYLAAKGILSPGKYFSITPCFRYESQNFEHRKSFMKCELIHYMPEVSYPASFHIINHAKEFFSKFLTDDDKLEIVSTDSGKDIYLNGIEIGSYGYRSHKGHKWIYGTGVAEPRFSLALTLNESVTEKPS